MRWTVLKKEINLKQFAFVFILASLIFLPITAMGEEGRDLKVTEMRAATETQPQAGAMDIVFNTKDDTWTLLGVNTWQEGAKKALPCVRGPFPLTQIKENHIPWNIGKYTLPDSLKSEGPFHIPVGSPMPMIVYPKKQWVGLIIIELKTGEDGKRDIILCWAKRVSVQGDTTTFRLVFTD